MNKEYNILATLRYEPHLAKLEEITSNANQKVTVTYHTLNDEFNLDSECNGYKWNLKLIEESTRNFTSFQKDFSELNQVVGNQHPFLNGSFSDKLIIDGDYKDFCLSRFLFVSQHLNRINMTLSHFNSPRDQLTADEFDNILVNTVFGEKKSAKQILNEIKKDEVNQPYKIRVLINKEGKIVTEAHPLPPPSFKDDHTILSCTQYFQRVLLSGFDNISENIWDIVKDSEPLKSTTAFTTFKTTNRLHYTLSRERMIEMITKYRYPSKDTTHCEIILHNENNEVMEGSISNIAIKRPGESQWITPPLSSGCLCGIFRYYLLQKGYVKVGKIQLNEISVGDTVLIFNGVMGCIKAIVR